MADSQGGDEMFAFCLTLGAGLATTIGAAMAFCIDQNNNLIFASCLAVAAGVMTYVSFVEILFKARDEYAVHGFSDADSNLAATLTFFAGLGVSIIIEHVTEYFFAQHSEAEIPRNDLTPVTPQAIGGQDVAKTVPASHQRSTDQVDIKVLQQVESKENEVIEPVQKSKIALGEVFTHTPAGAKVTNVDKPNLVMSRSERLNMMQMAAFSGVAIAAHNLPEGLATFIAAVEDPAFGVSMAIAIAIHNVPEGLAVAIPILKATNSKRKAFLWAFLSGVAEPIGALLAWLFLREVISPLTYAMVFGVIGGVMVHISIRKLLPTALQYDPENQVASYAFFAGMGVMAASLVFFEY
jgi:ZIP family zinc transporter